MNVFKLGTYFIICFVLFYIQPIDFGFIKGSILTDIILFLFLGVGILTARKVYTDRLGNLSLLQAVKILFSPNIFDYFSDGIYDFFKFSIFPLFYFYIKNKVKTIEQLEGLIKFFSSFSILSAIPYLLHILKPIAEGYKLDIFGEDNENGFVGIFQNSHSAGVVTSLAIINLIFFTFIKKQEKEKYKSLFIALIAIGFFVVYKTYVRTAYLTLVVGLVVILFKQFKLRYIGRYFGFFVLISTFMVILFANDTTLQNRLEDKQEYSKGNAKEDVGSGRLIFQLASINIWEQSSPSEKILGVGLGKLHDEMYKRVDLKINTHNGFTDAFVKEGVIGLIIFLCFLLAIFRKIYSSKNNEYKTLCYATYFSYLFFQFVQGGVITPMIEIFVVFNVSLLNRYNHAKKNNNHPDFVDNGDKKQLLQVNNQAL